MNRKVIKCFFMALAVGLISSPCTAKADQLVKPVLISAQLPQDTVKAVPISAELPKGITTNKVEFDVVDSAKAPEALMRKINVYKDKEGFVYYSDSNTGDIYIAVMRGEKPTGGYGVDVKYVEDVEGRTLLHVQESDPEKNAIVTERITYPYTIIKVNVPSFMVNVENLQGRSYAYYDILRDIKPIGVDSTDGILKSIYEENNFIFIEVEGNDGQSHLFYTAKSEEENNKVKNLKVNRYVNIKYALGTPEKSGDKMAMPLNDINQVMPLNEANNYNNVQCNKKVASDKEWVVSFTKEVNEKNINNSNVYVKDLNGNNIPVKIALCGKKSIKITPITAYKSGETYCLFITNKIDSGFKGCVMQFQIEG